LCELSFQGSGKRRESEIGEHQGEKCACKDDEGREQRFSEHSMSAKENRNQVGVELSFEMGDACLKISSEGLRFHQGEWLG
jgi:hypothetical protein